jgi:hypothetical protein
MRDIIAPFHGLSSRGSWSSRYTRDEADYFISAFSVSARVAHSMNLYINPSSEVSVCISPPTQEQIPTLFNLDWLEPWNGPEA